MASSSTTVFLVLILIISIGELGAAPVPPGSAGGPELAPLASAAGGGRSRGKGELTVTTPGPGPGPAPGGLTATLPRSASAAAGGSASELMPAGPPGATTTAGMSPLVDKELDLLLDLVDFGSNCSSIHCIKCILEATGFCLTRALTCIHPVTTFECLFRKFLLIEDCFGDVELGSAGAERELMPPPGSPGGSAGELTATPAAALLRQNLALADLGSSCSDNCKHCLLDNIGSCTFDAVECVDPWEMLRCLVENFLTFKDCFGTE